MRECKHRARSIKGRFTQSPHPTVTRCSWLTSLFLAGTVLRVIERVLWAVPTAGYVSLRHSDVTARKLYHCGHFDKLTQA